MTPVNPEWAARGVACRNRRVNDPRYRTQREQAAVFGMDLVTLSKMENGKMDPTPLERAWGIEPPASEPASPPPVCCHRTGELRVIDPPAPEPEPDPFAPDLGGEGGC